MHILVFIILLFVVFWLLLKSMGSASSHSTVTGNNDDDVHDDAAPLTTVSPVYVSDGKLYIQKADQNLHIESQYVNDMEARMERTKKLAGWKEGTTWETSFAQMNGMGDAGTDQSDIRFASVMKIDESRLIYFLKSGTFGGLFEYDMTSGKELRLLHKQNIDYRDFSRPNDQGQMLFSSVQSGQNCHIAVMDADGNNSRELTGGDTIDAAPSWVNGEPDQIVYQSQGLARDQLGYIKGVAPAAINLLNIKSGELKTIFSNENFDFLKPQVSNSGDLYFIRRPYETPAYSNSNAFWDTLFFPFRLLRAVFHYLNFFSMMYSRKPLTSADGPQIREDAKTILIKGRRIDTEKALRKGQHVQGVPSLVPNTWELVKCDKNGNQCVVATNVSSFFVDAEDQIIYTNGCGIFILRKGGRPQKILQEKLIEELVC